MELMRWVEATDLKRWADKKNCQEYLPLLIRRLIRANAHSISHIEFPAGDSVFKPGYDGILEVLEGADHIPNGISVWEMGCNKQFKAKAEKDYINRKKEALDVNPSETTFIFVTPRTWNKKTEWCEEKKKEGFWKDVKAYDAETLEEWIEQTPSVGIWLGKHLKKYPEGVISLKDWWDGWSNSTKPVITSKLVLAGRNDYKDSLVEFLKSSPESKKVQAATIDESIAFLAASINSLSEEDREFNFSRSIVVKNSEAFKHISITSRNGLLLIPEFEEIQGLSSSIKKDHHIYIPIGPDNIVASPDIVLQRLGKDAFISALIEMGLSNENAQKYSRDTGRSLTVLRRQLTDDANQPKWAKEYSARDIIPALLVSRWDESNDADKEIIALLADDSYGSFSGKLYSWQHKPDSPVLKIGSYWRLISAIDAFFALAPFITANDLDQFKNIILKILRSIDPALELKPEKRWMGPLYDKKQEYSTDLRKGIIQTLILIAIFGDNVMTSLPIKAQTWVDNVIRELLYSAECNLWNSLSDVLTLIAEASPTSFMDAVETSLSKEDKPIMCLFNEFPSILWPSSNHSSLLWALEVLAWSPKLLSRAALILGRLVKFDPGGKLLNRPARSLREIFLLWNPQTYAPLNKRLEVLDILLKRYPEVGWNLLIDLMPKNNDIGHPTSKPIWRQFSEELEVQVTISERIKSVEEIINRLISYVGTNGQHWIKILDNYPSLPVDERQKIIKHLSLCQNKISTDRNELWNKLRKIISRHRSYPDSDWALPNKELDYLEEIYLVLSPKNVIDQNYWLFNEYRPDLLKGIKRNDHDEEEKLFFQLRSDALSKIKNEFGFEGLVNLAKKIKYPEIIGKTLAKEKLDETEEEKLYSLLEEENESIKIVVHEFIFRKAFNNEKWIEYIVKKAKSDNWSDSKVVNLFVSFPSRMVVWNLLISFNKNIQEDYWKKCRFGGITKASEDKIYYLNHMIQVKRYFTALDIAALYSKEIPPELIAKILEKAATEKSEDEFRIEDWDIERLFEELYNSNYPKNEIAKLEWFYLSFLTDIDSKKSPKMLYSELSNNPEFFVEVMRYAYKRKDGTKDKEEEKLSTDFLKQRAIQSSKLIHSWNIIPGSENNSQINYEKLKKWVLTVRTLCKKFDRIGICDDRIGNLLAQADSDDNNWPPEAVCKIIEEMESKPLQNGFSAGIFNRRGAYTKSLDEGGIQERILARKYKKYSKKLETRYPITSSILNHIAEDYENRAKKEDNESEIIDLDF